MFLSRRKFRWRAIYKHHFIDVWGRQLQKKNFARASTRKFLQFYHRYVKKAIWWLHYRTQSEFARQSGFYKRYLTQGDIGQLRTGEGRDHIKLRKFFMRALLNYFDLRFHHVRTYRSAVLVSWLQRRHRMRARTKDTRLRFDTFYRLNRRSWYIISERVNAYYQATYFGFSTLSGFRSFLKKHSSRVHGWKLSALGIESMFAHQLYRLGFFPTIRFTYSIIRAGGLKLNGQEERRPRKLLSVGDEFTFVYPFSSVVLTFYIWRIHQRQLWYGIPAYFDFNFKLMSFMLWRRPTVAERRYIPFYPFVRRDITHADLLSF